MNRQIPKRRSGPPPTANSKPAAYVTSRNMTLRRFNPHFLAEIQALLREAFDLTENDTLPDVFRVPIAVPLKIGISPDLQDRYGLRNASHPRHKILNRALKRYCRSTQYHHAILSTKTRFDMNLRPAQPITDEDRRIARTKLEWSRKAREKARVRKSGEETKS